MTGDDRRFERIAFDGDEPRAESVDDSIDPLVDFVVGQLRGDAAESMRVQVERDPELAAEAAAIRRDLAGFGALECDVTGRAGASARWVARRQLERKAPRGVIRLVPSLRALGEAAAIVAVAASALVALWAVGGFGADRAASDRADDQPLAAGDGPVGPAAIETGRSVLGGVTAIGEVPFPMPDLEVSAGVVPEPFEWFDPAQLGDRFAASLRDVEGQRAADPLREALAADRKLAMLREARSASLGERRSVLAQRGVRPADARIAKLEHEVLRRLRARLDTIPESGRLGQQLVPDVAAACRALLAARTSRAAIDGDPQVTPSGPVLERAYALLGSELGGLEGGALAAALGAFVDRVVMVEGSGAERRLLLEHGGRLVRSTLQLHDGRRPHLLHWTTAEDGLADAGRVLAVLPAFGVDALEASRARMLVAAHLRERYDRRDRESPELLAAMAYGFGDLVDRDWVDHRLRLWRLELLVPDYVALEHLTWSSYPVRAGWADFQRELLVLASYPTPDGLRDASALLLSLAVHDAAPGAATSLGLIAAADG